MKATRTCSIPACTGTASSRGWCHTHYTRWRDTGDVRASEPIRRAGRGCAVEGCENPHQAKGYCKRHWGLWRSNGDPLINKRAVPASGYPAVHDRVKRRYGPASTHRCVSCGSQAADWAYDHADPDELMHTSRRGLTFAYSAKINHYRPMCKLCHRRFDASQKTACPSGHEYATFHVVSPKGKGYCRECHRLAYQRRQLAKITDAPETIPRRTSGRITIT